MPEPMPIPLKRAYTRISLASPYCRIPSGLSDHLVRASQLTRGLGRRDGGEGVLYSEREMELDANVRIFRSHLLLRHEIRRGITSL
jgi:hypothetical protein